MRHSRGGLGSGTAPDLSVGPGPRPAQGRGEARPASSAPKEGVPIPMRRELAGPADERIGSPARPPPPFRWEAGGRGHPPAARSGFVYGCRGEGNPKDEDVPVLEPTVGRRIPRGTGGPETVRPRASALRLSRGRPRANGRGRSGLGSSPPGVGAGSGSWKQNQRSARERSLPSRPAGGSARGGRPPTWRGAHAPHLHRYGRSSPGAEHPGSKEPSERGRLPPSPSCPSGPKRRYPCPRSGNK